MTERPTPPSGEHGQSLPPGQPNPQPVEIPPDAAARPAVQYAGWWRRVGAELLDGLIVIIPVAGLTFGIAEAVDPGALSEYLDPDRPLLDYSALDVIFGSLTVLAYWAYKGAMLTRRGPGNGSTVGLKALDIRVVMADRTPVGWRTATIREMLAKGLLFGQALLFVVPAVNYLWPLWDKENRALHDMMASTRVVRA